MILNDLIISDIIDNKVPKDYQEILEKKLNAQSKSFVRNYRFVQNCIREEETDLKADFEKAHKRGREALVFIDHQNESSYSSKVWKYAALVASACLVFLVFTLVNNQMSNSVPYVLNTSERIEFDPEFINLLEGNQGSSITVDQLATEGGIYITEEELLQLLYILQQIPDQNRFNHTIELPEILQFEILGEAELKPLERVE